MSDRLIAVGADGARGGWVAALGYGTRDEIDRIEVTLARDFAELAGLHMAGAPLAVDIPMGLLDTVAPRPCDVQARRRLGARASTVFAPPSRSLLEATSYAEARELIAKEREFRPTAKGLSAQAFGIAAKIREADAYLQTRPHAQDWLWECHPELSFQTMAGGRVLSDKKSVGGQAARLALLGERLPDVLDALERVTVGRRRVELADALDTLACLVTSWRIRAGIHEVAGGELDARGLRMRIAC